MRWTLLSFLLTACQLPGLPESFVAPGPTSVCGNGEKEGAEACDDGNSSDKDGCTTACLLASCGDGIHRRDQDLGDPGYEECDDGNDADGDACTNDCRAARCGDGLPRTNMLVTDPGYEQCDDGNTLHSDACTNDCLWAVCGDGILRSDLSEGAEGYEACDDGNTIEEDGCRNDCSGARCGDGLRRADLGAGSLTACTEAENLCPAGESCRLDRCMTIGFEACDDGDDEDSNSCRNNCIAAVCGDGVLRSDLQEGDLGYEACDDGDEDDTDECVSGCQWASCGDGFLRADLGAGSGIACRSGEETPCPEGEACLAGFCLTAGFEACDDGNRNELDLCGNNCGRLGFDASHPGDSCQDLLELGRTESGLYWVDPDGAEGYDPVQVYCEQVTEGGGWTLILGEGAAPEPPCHWFALTDENAEGDPVDLAANTHCSQLLYRWTAPYVGGVTARLTLAPGFAFSRLQATGRLYSPPSSGGTPNTYSVPNGEQRHSTLEPIDQIRCYDNTLSHDLLFLFAGDDVSWAIQPYWQGPNLQLLGCQPRDPLIEFTSLRIK